MDLDFDVLFLVGLVFVPLAFVAFVSAWADRRRPWAALILCAMALVLVGLAYFGNPEGNYSLANLPDLFFNVIARYSG